MNDEKVVTDLLDASARSVAVGPAPVDSILSRGRNAQIRRRLSLGVSLTALVVIALAGANVHADLFGPGDSTSRANFATITPPDSSEVQSGTLADGRTYGPMPSGSENVPITDLPDLVGVVGDTGVTGYVETKLLLSLDAEGPNSPPEALGGQSDEPRQVPVYAADGVSVVDTFTFSGSFQNPARSRSSE